MWTSKKNFCRRRCEGTVEGSHAHALDRIGVERFAKASCSGVARGLAGGNRSAVAASAIPSRALPPHPLERIAQGDRHDEIDRRAPAALARQRIEFGHNGRIRRRAWRPPR